MVSRWRRDKLTNLFKSKTCPGTAIDFFLFRNDWRAQNDGYQSHLGHFSLIKRSMRYCRSSHWCILGFFPWDSVTGRALTPCLMEASPASTRRIMDDRIYRFAMHISVIGMAWAANAKNRLACRHQIMENCRGRAQTAFLGTCREQW